jgi:hypothetical protein
VAEHARPGIRVGRGRVGVKSRPRSASGGAPFTPGMTADEVAALMAWMPPEMMVDAMLQEVDALGIVDGLSHADRARRVAELRARLDELERAEEAAISAAAEQGQDVPRRADASPAAVLQVRTVGAREMAA